MMPDDVVVLVDAIAGVLVDAIAAVLVDALTTLLGDAFPLVLVAGDESAAEVALVLACRDDVHAVNINIAHPAATTPTKRTAPFTRTVLTQVGP